MCYTFCIMRRFPWFLLACLLVLLSIGILTQTLSFLMLFLGAVLGILLAWMFPRWLGFAALFFAPWIGWLLSFRLEQGQYADRLFAGSVDIPVSDVFAVIALGSLGLWTIRERAWRDVWQRLPILRGYALLAVAHLASALSLARPDPLTVIKFSLRPVAFSYLAFVALPNVFLRTWRDVRIAFGGFVLGASLFAIQGFFSLFVNEQWSVLGLHRARPLPFFGVYPIGANHNVLAEWLVVAAPFALALACWSHDTRIKRWLYGAAMLCATVAALTFARSAWIVLVAQALVLLATVWRDSLRALWRLFTRGLWMVVVPLVGYMAWFSLTSQVASSTDARAMLTGIAWRWFTLHPLVGAGAGTFYGHVGETVAYRLLFGGPMDAHGILQKLAAETGLFGLGAYAVVSLTILMIIVQTVRRIGWRHRIGEGFVYASVGVLGAWVYQLFNTTYWSAKLWLPIGLLFVVIRLLRPGTRV